MYESSKPVHIRRSTSVVSTTYPQSAYQWLAEVLDELIDFGDQHGHYGVINLTEDEYQWLDDVLEELIYSVGDNENHPLASLMEFVVRLINDYEETYVPKLTEQSLKLAEKETIQSVSEDDLAAYAFFSIGYLLYEGKQVEKALFANEKAITLNPDFIEAYANRGMVKIGLERIEEAKSDFQIALELAKQQGQEDLITFIQNQIQELNNSKPQDHEN